MTASPLRAPRLIEAAADERDPRFLDGLNEIALKLGEMRAAEIRREGPFARSKLAWKLAGYQQVLLHRAIALFDGTAVSLNSSATLAAMLSARALMETIAIIVWVAGRAETHLAQGDLSSLDTLAQQGIFATRDEVFLSKHPEYRASSVLKYLQKVDRRAPGFLRHYEYLSERCHPNSLGHNFMFSELDHTDGTVRFFDQRKPEANRTCVLAGIGSLVLVEPAIRSLEASVASAAALQHKLNPVGE